MIGAFLTKDEAGGSGIPSVLAGGLGLAAAPTFAVMALLTDDRVGAATHMHGAGADGPWPSGMALMYVLMSAFHLAPWLRLLAGTRHSGSEPV